MFKARSEFYWSSSTWANYPGYAWLVRFDGGDITVSHDDKDSHSLVRAVRNVK